MDKLRHQEALIILEYEKPDRTQPHLWNVFTWTSLSRSVLYLSLDSAYRLSVFFSVFSFTLHTCFAWHDFSPSLKNSFFRQTCYFLTLLWALTADFPHQSFSITVSRIKESVAPQLWPSLTSQFIVCFSGYVPSESSIVLLTVPHKYIFAASLMIVTWSQNCCSGIFNHVPCSTSHLNTAILYFMTLLLMYKKKNVARGVRC